MSNKPRLGAGNVEIELDGETCVLKPSLRATQGISRNFGGISEAIQSISKMDFDALVNVIALGLNKTDKKEREEIAEQVYATGMTDLAAPAIKYLSILANGGRPHDATGGDTDEENPPKD